MSDFSVRSDSVDVEQIMRQIRGRIRDKRGVDYTEQQIQELANAKLEKFLDPSGLRSDLLTHFRTMGALELYPFEDTTLFDSDKPVVRFFRRLLKPFTKLLFSPNALSSALHKQAALNRQLAFLPELVHNLVVELTRTGIEVKNLKMRVESLQSRLEFTERRSRALEGVVQYRPEALKGVPRSDAPVSGPAAEGTEPQGGVDPLTGGESIRTKRRRRRRGRRGQGLPGGPESGVMPGGSTGDADAEDLSPDDSEGSDPTGSDPTGSDPGRPPGRPPTTPGGGSDDSGQ